MLVAAANIQEECPLNQMESKSSESGSSNTPVESQHAYSNLSFVENEKRFTMHPIKEELEGTSQTYSDYAENVENEVSLVKVKFILNEDEDVGNQDECKKI